MTLTPRNHAFDDATLCIWRNESSVHAGSDLNFTDARKSRLDDNWHDFKGPRTACSEYQSQASLFLEGQSSSPVLLCAVGSSQGQVNVSVLDTGVCTDRGHMCSVPDTLAQSDHNSFDAFGHKAVMQVVVWCFAISAVLGNIAVIIHCAPTLIRDFHKLVKTEKVHRWLVLNLAVSDLLMGVYIVMYGLAHNHHDHVYNATDRYKWLSSQSCTMMGVLSFVSSQMSVSMLVIITSFRLDSVLCPFREHRKQFHTAVAVTLLSWIVWIAYAMVPLLPFELIRSIFDNFVKVDPVRCFNQTDMHYDYFVEVMRKVDRFIYTNCGPTVAANYTVTDEARWSSLVKVGKDLNLLDKSSVPEYFGYYNEQSVCTAKYFVTHTNRSAFFTLAVVVFNLTSFLYILLAYATVWRNTMRQWVPQCLCCTATCSDSNDDTNKTSEDRRSRENRNMQMRIVVIIATDFVCWVPLCTMSLFHFIKSADYSADTCDYHGYMNVWQGRFSLLALILLPINSAINPFIYSFRYWGVIKQRILGFVTIQTESAVITGERV